MSMHDTDGPFPDDVPVADAVEQQRLTDESPPDAEDAISAEPDGELPLEASAADWQEQRQEVVTDPGYDEPGL